MKLHQNGERNTLCRDFLLLKYKVILGDEMEDEKTIVTGRQIDLDIAKGIGIILVVWAHASGPLSGYINQFLILLEAMGFWSIYKMVCRNSNHGGKGTYAWSNMVFTGIIQG